MINKGLYQYCNNLYSVIGECKVKNSITREWQKHILYIEINSGDLCTREEQEFLLKFERAYKGSGYVIRRKVEKRIKTQRGPGKTNQPDTTGYS